MKSKQEKLLAQTVSSSPTAMSRKWGKGKAEGGRAKHPTKVKAFFITERDTMQRRVKLPKGGAIVSKYSEISSGLQGGRQSRRKTSCEGRGGKASEKAQERWKSVQKSIEFGHRPAEARDGWEKPVEKRSREELPNLGDFSKLMEKRKIGTLGGETKSTRNLKKGEGRFSLVVQSRKETERTKQRTPGGKNANSTGIGKKRTFNRRGKRKDVSIQH